MIQKLTVKSLLDWDRVPYGDLTTILVEHCDYAQRYVLTHVRGGTQRPQKVRCCRCKKTWATVPADKPIRVLVGRDHVYKIKKSVADECRKAVWERYKEGGGKVRKIKKAKEPEPIPEVKQPKRDAAAGRAAARERIKRAKAARKGKGK